MISKKNEQTILCILDGWGISKRVKGNAIKLARTPNFDNLVNNCPNANLVTHGPLVGLPENQVGKELNLLINIQLELKYKIEVMKINTRNSLMRK